MKCRYCLGTESKVVDSRPTDDGTSIRRRRECITCGKRFTTYEKIEEIPIMVVKKDGSRQSFERRKVLGGMIRACEKRPVPLAELEKIIRAEGVTNVSPQGVRAHPALVEARQQRVTLAKLVASLRIPMDDAQSVGRLPQQRVGIRAVK